LSSFDETIEKLKEEIGIHVTQLKSHGSWAQLEKLYVALGTIQDLAGESRTSLVELLGIEGGPGQGVRITPGEFYGVDAGLAAKRFLKRKGSAATLDEIIQAIESGGAKVNRHDLRISLSRSTWDVAKVGQDMYGLLEFYPHVKRGKKKSGESGGPDEPTDEAPSDVGNGATS
jgi:hypothetical protein